MKGPGVPERYHRDPGMRMPTGFSFGATETLLAIVAIHARGQAVTIRGVGRELGGRSPSTVHIHVHNLVDAGLVRIETGRAATIRPAVELVAHTPPDREQESRDLVLALDRGRRRDRGR